MFLNLSVAQVGTASEFTPRVGSRPRQLEYTSNGRQVDPCSCVRLRCTLIGCDADGDSYRGQAPVPPLTRIREASSRPHGPKAHSFTNSGRLESMRKFLASKAIRWTVFAALSVQTKASTKDRSKCGNSRANTRY